jgi:hypothetical protein
MPVPTTLGRSNQGATFQSAVIDKALNGGPLIIKRL